MLRISMAHKQPALFVFPCFVSRLNVSSGLYFEAMMDPHSFTETFINSFDWNLRQLGKDVWGFIGIFNVREKHVSEVQVSGG